MLSLLTTLLGLTVAAVKAQDISPSQVDADLISNGLIPDVFPPQFVPSVAFEVVFRDDDGALIPIRAGMNMTVANTKNQPLFAIFSNDTTLLDQQFLIAMVDPDHPTPTNNTLSQVLHFIGPNYQGQRFSDSDEVLFFLNNQTAPTVTYAPPGPPPYSPAHRYTLAVFRQTTHNITIDPSEYPADRVHFNLREFAENRGDLVPIGATFMYIAANSTDESLCDADK